MLDKILHWKRFIDDILLLFKGFKQECEALVNWLNSLQLVVIKFKFEFSNELVEFWDLQIMIENSKLETNLHIKPTKLQLYLDFFSNGQALRILERCSKTEDAEKHLDDLKSKLKPRNYPEELISKQFYEANKKPRKELISKREAKTRKMIK